jgi:hypothetical protein
LIRRRLQVQPPLGAENFGPGRVLNGLAAFGKNRRQEGKSEKFAPESSPPRTQAV